MGANGARADLGRDMRRLFLVLVLSAAFGTVAQTATAAGGTIAFAGGTPTTGSSYPAAV